MTAFELNPGTLHRLSTRVPSVPTEDVSLINYASPQTAERVMTTNNIVHYQPEDIFQCTLIRTSRALLSTELLRFTATSLILTATLLDKETHSKDIRQIMNECSFSSHTVIPYFVYISMKAYKMINAHNSIHTHMS